MLDPQGYPLQQYTNLDGDIVLEVLSDGTIVLINGTTMSSGTGSPEGVVTAPPGSWYIQTNGVSPNFWFQKQVGSGNTGWASIGTGVANIITSVFGRFGDVVAESGDYGAVTDLTLGDGTSFMTFGTVAGDITIDDGVGNEIGLDGTDAITLSAIATINLDAPAVLVNGSPIGGATSVFGRTGAVVAAANDYSAVPDLQVGDGAGQEMVINTAGSLLELIGGGVNINLSGSGIQLVAGGNQVLINATVVNFGATKINNTGLQIFANNAAAITGGLNVGDFYRNGANPDVVCVVH